jgi:hypothetical protein
MMKGYHAVNYFVEPGLTSVFGSLGLRLGYAPSSMTEKQAKRTVITTKKGYLAP